MAHLLRFRNFLKYSKTHVPRMGETANKYRMLMGQSLGKGPFSKTKRWGSNISMDLKELGSEDGRWIKLVQNHVQ
jgi:hypothetical protein